MQYEQANLCLEKQSKNKRCVWYIDSIHSILRFYWNVNAIMINTSHSIIISSSHPFSEICIFNSIMLPIFLSNRRVHSFVALFHQPNMSCSLLLKLSLQLNLAYLNVPSPTEALHLYFIILLLQDVQRDDFVIPMSTS